MDKPTRCIDPVLKCCQYCKYGYVVYPEWVETYEDTFDVTFESGCCFSLEECKSTEDEVQELKESYEKYI